METLYHQDSIEISPRGVKNGAGLLLELVNKVLDMGKSGIRHERTYIEADQCEAAVRYDFEDETVIKKICDIYNIYEDSL